MYRERIAVLIDLISHNEDSEYVEIIRDLLESAAEYIKKVVSLEAALSIAKLNKEGNEYRAYIQQLDSSRSTVHNKLIGNVKLVNRLCSNYGIPVIYDGDENNRIEIAEFARQLILQYFNTRKL